MGGMSVLVLAGFGMALLAVFAIAAVAFIAGVVIALVFALRTRKRREHGRKLGGLVALPIALIVLSSPVLAWCSATLVIPTFESATTTDYADCTQMVATHDPAGLEAMLGSLPHELDAEGPRSYRDLIRLAIVYEDEECLEVGLDAAQAAGHPVDLNLPLEVFDEDGEAVDSSFALIMAVSEDYCSPDMVDLLLEHGAGPDVVDENGMTPLLFACSGSCIDPIEENGKKSIEETISVISLLLKAGADADIVDPSGKTPHDLYSETIAELADRGAIDADEKREALGSFPL